MGLPKPHGPFTPRAKHLCALPDDTVHVLSVNPLAVHSFRKSKGDGEGNDGRPAGVAHSEIDLRQAYVRCFVNLVGDVAQRIEGQHPSDACVMRSCCGLGPVGSHRYMPATMGGLGVTHSNGMWGSNRHGYSKDSDAPMAAVAGTGEVAVALPDIRTCRTRTRQGQSLNGPHMCDAAASCLSVMSAPTQSVLCASRRSRVGRECSPCRTST